MGIDSCIGCKFLYCQQAGYSNYTVIETFVLCALGRNPALVDAERPYDWCQPTAAGPQRHEIHPDLDNWGHTMNGRCEAYALQPGNPPALPISYDCGDKLEDFLSGDPEQFEAIRKHKETR